MAKATRAKKKPPAAVIMPERNWASLYRPRNFDELIGQNKAVDIISDKLASGRFPQLVILTGHTSVGKTTIARIISQMVTGYTGKNAEANPDLHEINAATMGKDEILKLISQLPMRPMSGSTCAVWLIDEAHLLTGGGASALLKPFEEPPPHVIFIVATNEPERLIETLKNRGLRIELEPYSENDVVDMLEQIAGYEKLPNKYDGKLFAEIANSGNLIPRDAISLLEKVVSLSDGDGDPYKALDKAYAESSRYSLDFLCGAILYCTYTNEKKSLAKALMSVATGMNIVPSLLELNSFLFDQYSGRQTYVSPVRADLKKQLGNKMPSFDFICDVHMAAVEARNDMLTGGAKEHHALMGRLGRLMPRDN